MAKRNSNQLVSIIVPAHNAGETLGRCLESLSAQTYKDIEVIVVVNACTDGTERIAQDYAARDPRVKPIGTETPGVSHARNLGLDAANGDRIGFVDADDWVEPDMFEALMVAAVGMSADVVCCGRIFDSSRGTSTLPAADHVTEVTADDFYYGVLMGPYGGSMWNKLFSSRALEGRRFDEEMAIIEDSAFCCALASDSLRFLAVPGCYYHYVTNETSATHDLSRLVTKDGKWAYLDGALKIQSRAASETQRRISEEVNCTFAASGVRELAGMREYTTLHRELCGYLRRHLRSFLKVEDDSRRIAKTLLALFAPGIWAAVRRSVKLLRRTGR